MEKVVTSVCLLIEDNYKPSLQKMHGFNWGKYVIIEWLESVRMGKCQNALFFKIWKCQNAFFFKVWKCQDWNVSEFLPK